LLGDYPARWSIADAGAGTVLPRHHAACNTASFHLKQTTPKTSDGRRGTDYFHGIELIRKGSAISKSCDRSHFLVAAR
jgi:hypothetical protein